MYRNTRRCLALLGIAFAAALEVALAFAVGARIIYTLEVAVLSLLLPVAAMVAIAAVAGWLARIDRRRQTPPVQVRWDELLRPPSPHRRVPGSVTPADIDEPQVLPVIPDGPPGRSPWTR